MIMGLSSVKACDIRGKRDEGKVAIPRTESNGALIAKTLGKTDGISIHFPDWRFNSRASNAGLLVRLNVESRADAAFGHDHAREIPELLAMA